MNKIVHNIYLTIFFLTGIFITIFILDYGYEYYTTSLEQIPLKSQESPQFADLHNNLKPSGYLGHGFGIAGTLLMIVGVASYMIRKRVKKLHRFGFLKHWLELHIFFVPCSAYRAISYSIQT
ncbi:MAG: hypothetical protein HXY49_05940 [Ignavibacteriaceae bacterium]|nr:hypothetical protein [Ignavibacteriaceae bacterium]